MVSTAKDSTVTSFTVASDTRARDAEGNSVPIFYRVSAWYRLGENCAKYLHKGDKLAIMGDLSMRTYSGKDGSPRTSLNVTLTDMEFLTTKPKDGAQTSQSYKKSTTETPVQSEAQEEEDDLPF